MTDPAPPLRRAASQGTIGSARAAFSRRSLGVGVQRSGWKRERPRPRRRALSFGVLREEAAMSGWLRAVLLAVLLMVGTWALLVLLARRLPPGLLRDLAGFVPDCVATVRRLRRDPRVPPRAKVVVALAGLWLLSPVDLLPEFCR
jgi:hypothetical protein